MLKATCRTFGEELRSAPLASNLDVAFVMAMRTSRPVLVLLPGTSQFCQAISSDAVDSRLNMRNCTEHADVFTASIVLGALRLAPTEDPEKVMPKLFSDRMRCQCPRVPVAGSQRFAHSASRGVVARRSLRTGVF